MNKIQKIFAVSFIVLPMVITVPRVWACIWDTDTLEMELEGLPGVMDIIVGRFPRNPDLYYQMRLTRVEKELEITPNALGLYDDAGVASDRLGLSDDALAWMNKKRLRLDVLDQISEEYQTHLYRYLANTGTFHAHRWFRNGGQQDDKKDLEQAIDLIEQAIILNPDAHFGRERYQLMFLKAVFRPKIIEDTQFELLGIDPQNVGRNPLYSVDDSFLMMQMLGIYSNALSANIHNQDEVERLAFKDMVLDEIGMPDVIEGLTGLIALGNSWGSVDVFFALSNALSALGDNSVALLATMRVKELKQNGHQSYIWFAGDKAWDFRDKLEARSGILSSVEMNRGAGVIENYEELRQNAQVWHENRERFMMVALQQGHHPDTHEDFWDGYEETPRGKLLKTRLTADERNRRLVYTVIAGCIALLGVYVLLKYRRRNQARESDTPGAK